MRRIALACALVAAVLAPFAVPASAPAATTSGVPGLSIIDLPDDEAADADAPLTRLAAADVQRRVELLPGFRVALTRRPEAQVVLRYDAVSETWTANLKERGSDTYLASAIISDVTGVLVATQSLGIGDYPSRLDERAAIDAAVADREVRRTARRWGGVKALRTAGRLTNGTWEVDLFDPTRAKDAGEPVVRIDVDDASGDVTGVWTGIQIPWTMARGDRRAFGGDMNEPGIWLPFFVLFALVAIDWTRLRSLLNVDVLAVLAFGISHECFQRGMIHASVPLAMPPLLWLFGRAAWIYVRGVPAQRTPRVPTRRLTRLALRRVPTIALAILCVALAGVRIGVTIDGGNVIDVGYAGVAGARLELKGKAPWGNMPADNEHGDTYGPANYLAYVPAVAAVDDVERDLNGHPLRAAQATSIAADLGCALLLLLIGYRWISRRGGVLLAAGWLACPWTAWALASGVNDALVALPLLAAFALLPRATLRGFLVGLAAMIKIAPLAALAPLLFAGSRARTKQAVLAMFGASVAVALGLGWVVWRLPHGIGVDLKLFYERTLAFQTERGSPFSIWGLYDWPTAQKAAQLVVVALLVAACVLPRRRDAWQVAAGVAAALMATQLVVTHWFYLYIPWFVGFLLLVQVAARERPVPEDAALAARRG
ncbi:MAG: hypothetical protein JWN72_822 [Thermoleophilia bacterium]|nr:hypothetical protein [Thermoleophilia bacterium]